MSDSDSEEVTDSEEDESEVNDSEEEDSEEDSEKDSEKDSDEDDSEDNSDEDDDDQDKPEENGKSKALGLSDLYEKALAEELSLKGTDMPSLYENALEESDAGHIHVQTEEKDTQTEPEGSSMLSTLSFNPPASSSSDFDCTHLLHDIQSISQDLSYILDDIRQTFQVDKPPIHDKPYNYPKYVTPQRLVPEPRKAEVIWDQDDRGPSLAQRYAEHRERRGHKTFNEQALLKHSANILLRSPPKPKKRERFETSSFRRPKSQTLQQYRTYDKTITQKKVSNSKPTESKAQKYLSNHLNNAIMRNPSYDPDDRPASFM